MKKVIINYVVNDIDDLVIALKTTEIFKILGFANKNIYRSITFDNYIAVLKTNKDGNILNVDIFDKIEIE